MNDSQRELYLGPLPAGMPLPGDSALAWLAGFVDGEGTITLAGRRGRSIQPSLSIPNTNLSNIGRVRVLLAALLGHDVSVTERKSDENSYRPCYDIRVGSHYDVDIALRAIYPHLVGKWKQAQLVLEFLTIAPGSGTNVTAYRRVRGREPRIGTRYDERHYAILDEIRRLNRRYARGQWQREHPPALESKPESPPGAEPMDPLKRLYLLRFG